MGFFCFVAVLVLPILHFGRWLVRGLMTRSLLSADHREVHWAENVEEWCVFCLPSMALWTVSWDAHITYERIRWLRLGSLCSYSEATSHPVTMHMYAQNVNQFSMNMNSKMFCINRLILYCLIILCIILCHTSKASENLTFALKQSHSVEWFCCHHYLLSGHEW